jgi:sulfite exporter TauE/SafE
MIAAAMAVLVASLIGSAHCAGMCGGIATMCAGAGECSARQSISASLVYHGCRLVSYAAVGALAGSVGTLLNAGGMLVGIQEIAALLAGLAIAIVGVGLLMNAGGVQSGSTALPAWLGRTLASIQRAAAAMPPRHRAMVIGLATPLLPCGWLWAFAAVAAGTGSLLGGTIVMIAFWTGTVPVLAVVGAGIAGLSGKRRRLLSALAGVAMIAVGIYTAGMRAPLAHSIAEHLALQRVNTSSSAEVSAVRPACCAEDSP